LAEAGRDVGILNASVLVDRSVRGGERMLYADEGSLERRMADDGGMYNNELHAHDEERRGGSREEARG